LQMPVSENVAVTCYYRVIPSDKIHSDIQAVTLCNTR
jgi:hypothetical protein